MKTQRNEWPFRILAVLGLSLLLAPPVVQAVGQIRTSDLRNGAVTDAKVASGISAAKLTTGTLPDARLSTAIPRYTDTTPTFVGDRFILNNTPPASATSSLLRLGIDPNGGSASGQGISQNYGVFTGLFYLDQVAGVTMHSINASGDQYMAGRMGIQTPVDADPLVGLALRGTFVFSNNTTDATAKYAVIFGRHYTNAQPHYTAFMGESNAGNNNIYYGGGNGDRTAATTLRFYTAATNTTLGGTERMRLEADGDLAVGGTSAGSVLEVNGSVAFRSGATRTTAATIAAAEHIVPVDPTTAGFTITIPAAAAGIKDRQYVIKNVSASTNTVTIAPASGTIDGAANVTITTAYGSRRVWTNGTAWFTL